jgi:2-phospho-L-lactate guanylyltransferase
VKTKTLSIIPVKSTATAKSRLANQLGPQAREALVFSLLLRTIRTLKACLNPKDILIVGLDADVERLAKREGLSFLKETGSGLNSALHQATNWAARHGFEAILISPLDLPFLSPEDIQAIIGLGNEERTMVIAPDRAYYGTNILLLNPPADFRFCFGRGSYKRHLKQSESCGLKQKVFYSFGTYFDLDDYDAYQVWMEDQSKANVSF